MRFVLEFSMDNAAFGENEIERNAEARRILKDVSGQLLAGDRGGIRDVNGNRIGEWSIEGAEG
jgi:hypothetical protein